MKRIFHLMIVAIKAISPAQVGDKPLMEVLITSETSSAAEVSEGAGAASCYLLLCTMAEAIKAFLSWR